MQAFAMPRAVSPKVATTLSAQGHYGVLDGVHQRARTYALVVTPDRVPKAVPPAAPRSLTLVFDGKDRTIPTQLHLGNRPIPARFWSYDPDRGALNWSFEAEGTDHGGHLALGHGGTRLVGNLNLGRETYGVQAVLNPVSYTCKVAQNTGATVTGTPPALQLSWNTSDPRWSSANWVDGALLFTWQITGQVIVGQWSYSIATWFADQQTNAKWVPDPSTFATLLDANYYFTMELNGGLNPGADDRSGLSDPAAKAIPTVFPYLLRFQVSPDGNTLTGAMLTVSDSQAGTVLGIQGTYANPSVVGLYSLPDASGTPMAVGVHDGLLHVQGQPVASSRLVGSSLSFSGLTDDQQKASGLPPEGRLDFSPCGARVGLAGADRIGGRVSPERAARLFADSPAASHPTLRASAAIGAASSLNFATLANMTQFTFANNVWSDAAQTATMADFNNVLLYYMPSDMRQIYYNTGQPTLPSWLQNVAAMGTNPQQWYGSLATSFLTNVMSTWNEDGANQLNAQRAMAWLKSQTAASPVFQVQSSAMYSHEFVALPQNQSLPQFLQDQQTNKATYSPLIQTDAASWQQQLKQEIVDPDALAAMQKTVTALSALAIQNGLYWAYAYFRYLTTPQALTIIQMMSLGTATDLDGSAFMRHCQTNVAVLSLLDPSNTFAQQYISVIQTFQIGNMLPTLFDYSGNPENYVFAVQQVLRQIAAQYQTSSDPDIQKAAAEAAQLAASSQLGDLIAAVQAAAVGRAGIYSWEQLAPLMAASVSKTIGTLGANLLCVALAGAGVMSLVFGVLNWSQLSTAQQVQIAANGAVFVIQIMSGVLKRGVALNACFEAGQTTWDTIKMVFKPGLVAEADARLQSGFSKWVVGKTTVEPPSEMFGNLFSEATQADETMVAKIFGKNMNEFLATRLGACLAVINLVVSIISALHATSTLEAVGDWLMVGAAGLDLLATAGGWALGAAGITEIGGFAVASICSVLGILAIFAAVAGVAILLYLAFKPHPNPVQQFGQDYAKPAGFFMQYGTEIDYFTGYAKDGEPSRLALSFGVPGSSNVLKVNADGSVTSAAPDYGYDTLFWATTNGLGQTQVMALVTSGSGSTATTNSMLLTAASNGTVSFQAPLPATDPNYGTQLWSIALQSSPTMDGDQPSSGSFSIKPFGSSQFLAWNGSGLSLGSSGPNWTITQSPMVAGGLSMQDVTLYTFSQGQSYSPSLTQPGSMPQTWTISPALPTFLAFDTTSGKVYEPTTAPTTLPVTAPATYTLSVTNGAMTAPIRTTFSIQVVEFSA